MKTKAKEIGTIIIGYFTSPKINQVAYKTGFVQRSSVQLTALVFLQAIVFASMEHISLTLSKVAQSCADLGVTITEQGLDKRINPKTVSFMKEMFSEAMRFLVNKQPLMVSVINQFSGVNLMDSSGIPLPKQMADLYPASRNTKAANLKLRVVFDFLRCCLKQVIFAPGKEADQSFDGYLNIIQPYSLNIMDLGFFKLKNFKTIADNKAYFLSRYKHRTTVFTPDEIEIDLLEHLSSNPQTIIEFPVLLGKTRQHHTPTRLIAFRLKQEVADQRRRKAKNTAKRYGQTVSSHTLALLDWSIYLTNAPFELLSPPQVACLYRVRWQIELLFKLIKTYFDLRRFNNLRPDRIFTELYAKLIAVVLTLFLFGPLRMPLAELPYLEISPVKVRQISQRFARSLSLLLNNPDLFIQTLETLFEHILRFGFKQKRKKKPNICHALILVSAFLQLPSSFWPPPPDFFVVDLSDILFSSSLHNLS